jgi:hypothetical protein
VTTLTFQRRRTRARARGSQVAAALAVAAGRLVGWVQGRLPLLPGLAGAGMVSYGAALVYLPAGVILGGVFLLAADRQIKIGPRGGE